MIKSGLLLILCIIPSVRYVTAKKERCFCPLWVSGSVNCCCDGPSRGYDHEAFINCMKQAKRQLNAVCINPAFYFGVNVNFDAFTDEHDYRCYFASSYDSLNYVRSPSKALSLSDTSELKSIFTKSFQHTFSKQVQEAEMLANEGISIQFDNGIRGLLSHPKAGADGTCNTILFPKFLHNSTHTCQQFLTVFDGGESCSSIPGLQTYAGGFTFLQRNGLTTVSNNSRFTIRISPIKCWNEFGTGVLCPKGNATLDMKRKLCENVIVKIVYTLIFNQTGLQQVGVDAVVRNNIIESFDRTFVVQFTQTPYQWSSAPVESQESDYLSGAPGYRAYYPIRAGVLTKRGLIQMTPVKITLPLDQRAAGGRTFGWWAVPAGGNCRSPLNVTTEISTVRFGVDFQSSCLLKYTSSISGHGNLSVCVALEKQILSVLNADMSSATVPTHVARWGNSSETNSSDWLPIEVSQVDSSKHIGKGVTATTRACKNIIIGQIIRLVYARTGELTNLQNQLLAVQRRFYRGTIAFKCGGRYCSKSNSNLVQTKSITTEVRFVDSTVTPVTKMQDRAVSEIWSLENFLYLFQASARARER